MAGDDSMSVKAIHKLIGFEDDRKASPFLQSDEGTHNDGSLSVTLRSSEQIVLSDTDEVTPRNLKNVADTVNLDSILRSFRRKKRTRTNFTHELAGPSNSSREEFLSGACSSKGLHSKDMNKSLNDQAEDSSSRRKLTKAMLEKNLFQVKRKKPETTAVVEHGDELVSRRIMVVWSADKKFYTGTITAFDPVYKMHMVTYDNGVIEVLNLIEEKWKPFVDRTPQEFVQSYKEEGANHLHPAKESLELKRNGHDFLNSQGYSRSAKNVVLVADTPEDSKFRQRSEEENIAGPENQTEPERRISSRSTKGYHYKHRFGRFFS